MAPVPAVDRRPSMSKTEAIEKVIEIYQDADPDFQRWIFQHIMKVRNSPKATAGSNR